MKKKCKEYSLRDGMVLNKTHCGRVYKLRVIRDGNALKFRIDHEVFSSLTAAARHVVRDETRQISGPLFWNAPLA